MSTINDQLIKHLDEAHAMEQNVLRMLDGMISTTDDPEILQELEHHKIETEGHAQRMRERLEAHGATPSTVKQIGGIWVPTRVTMYNQDNQEAAVMQYDRIKVNSGLPDRLFEF